MTLKVVLLKIHHLLLLHSQRIMKPTFMKRRMMTVYVSYYGYGKVYSTFFKVFIFVHFNFVWFYSCFCLILGFLGFIYIWM
jgi:hypothetical protein